MSEAESSDARQWREALRWLGFADEDLRVAKSIIADPSLLGPTAFHIQQVLEKVLKALLVAAGADFRRVHDIGELAGSVHRHWPEIVPIEFPLARVTIWYALTRYPGLDQRSISAAEVAGALEAAESLFTRVMQLVPADASAALPNPEAIKSGDPR
jgi:HEPN domain-containing protein